MKTKAIKAEKKISMINSMQKFKKRFFLLLYSFFNHRADGTDPVVLVAHA